jgi:hypothetical protein
MLEGIGSKAFLYEFCWRDMWKDGDWHSLEDVALPISDPRKAVGGEIRLTEVPSLLCEGFPEVIVLIERSVARGTS